MSYETENKVKSIKFMVGDELHQYSVGNNNITKITENKPSGEGDKWHYDVYINDKLDSREFNVDSVDY